MSSSSAQSVASRCVLLAVSLCVACAADTPSSSARGGGSQAGSAAVSGGGGNGGGSGSADFGNGDASALPVGDGNDASIQPDTLPDAGVIRDEDCGKITAIVRDFSPTTHPDFEIMFNLTNLGAFTGQGQKGIVKPLLEMGYPAYAPAGPTANTAGADKFYQWYVDTPGVNMHLEVTIPLTEDTPGHFIYDNSMFFPVDGMGFGNEGNAHNFHFTTELRTKFTYEGGETFTFRGDDDLWMFVDGVLAIDLGGLHGALEASVNMDTFAAQNGLVKGETYSMDIFHAERHTSESNFRIETTIKCFVPVVPPPPPPPPPPPQ